MKSKAVGFFTLLQYCRLQWKVKVDSEIKIAGTIGGVVAGMLFNCALDVLSSRLYIRERTTSATSTHV